MRERTHLRLQGQRGQALIESLLMLVVIITVVLWVFELGWLMYTYSVLADAANEGVRYAIVHSGADPTGTQTRSEEHTSELQSRLHLVCRLLLEKKKHHAIETLL